MQIETEVSLFVRDRATGRNSKAIEALGLWPVELARRGYALAERLIVRRLCPKIRHRPISRGPASFVWCIKWVAAITKRANLRP
jgi:hypothetical protein